MDLFYWKSSEGNFGDDINAWLWCELLPGWRDCAPEVSLFGVGTLLNKKNLERFRGKRALILGTGVGYGQCAGLELDKSWDFRALRGRRSAEALGLPSEIGIADPAIALSDLACFKGLTCCGEVVFVPHIGSVQMLDWAHACAEAGVRFVDPRGEAKAVVRAIASAKLVIAESMHAAIIADSFRVPWVAVSVGADFNRPKWNDFLDAIDHRGEIGGLTGAKRIFPLRVGPISTRKLSDRIELGRLKAQAPQALARLAALDGFLSQDGVVDGLKARYYETLDCVRRDYGISA